MSRRGAFVRSAVLVVAGFLAGSNMNNAICNELGERASAGGVDPPPASSAEDDASIPLLDIPPSAKQIVINVGTSVDPILPAASMGPCARTIAIEPIVGHDIPDHRQVSVVHAAVGARPGTVVSMNVYNEGGQSSSLARPSRSHYWNANVRRGDGRTVLVPVVALSSVVRAVPNATEISLLKTDMQGFDFVAVREAGTALRERVSHVMTEVWLNDHYTYHAENDLCRDWLPFMTDLGYDLVRLRGAGNDGPEEIRARCRKQLEDHPVRPGVAESAGLDESDAYWVRRGSEGVPFPDCPKITDVTKEFTALEYAACG